jgi:NAD(P)-dependent dehydrogenase (short-subunit alcohol dehydrogenase family)
VDLGLKGKVALVTGASQGIGAEIARELAREGCTLLLTARSAARLTERVAEIAGLGGKAVAHPADLREPGAGAAVVDAALQAFGRIDIAVNVAGSAKMGDLLELSDADWAEGFALKFFGHMRLIRAAWPHLKASGGAIATIAGSAGRTPSTTGILTGSINGALLPFSKALAERGIADGVQVNVISPGAVRTDRFDGRVKRAMETMGVDAAEAERRIVAAQGIARIAEPADVAGLVAFVVSPRGRQLQGAMIEIDGGKTKTI